MLAKTAMIKLVFSNSDSFWGSGFLAIVMADVIVDNSSFVFQRRTFLFQDSTASSPRYAGYLNQYGKSSIYHCFETLRYANFANTCR